MMTAISPYNEISAPLKRARNEARLSLVDVGHMLHIRPRYLEALEEGRLADLPGLAYTRGYLQSYAAFLQLDRDEILRRFDAIEGLGHQKLVLPQVFSSEKKPHRLTISGGMAAAFILLLLWLLMQPWLDDLSLVEPWRDNKRPLTLMSAPMAETACAHQQKRLYPPCHVANSKMFYYLPMTFIAQTLRDAQAGHEQKKALMPWQKPGGGIFQDE